MKKLLADMNKDRGFFLPYTMFIVTIVFLAISAHATFYSNEMVIKENLIEQIKVETLFQMARARFSEDQINSNSSEGRFYYEFPYGEVEITSTRATEEMLVLHFKIMTDKQTEYTLTNPYHLREKTGDNYHHAV